MKKDYYFANGEFVIENFDQKKTFSSFLPAIAGKKGVPGWSFYVNRGQGMSSFGIRDKNGSILEFFPAYTAYEVINRIGFRTFVRINGKTQEIFCVKNNFAKRSMHISREKFKIREINKKLGIQVDITYFGLPNEPIAGLVRKVEVKNISDNDLTVELLDGCTQIFTPGTEYGAYKAVSNLLRSWMGVFNLENNMAFYKLRASTGDSEEVREILDGNFYMSFVDNKLVKPICDPYVIFGADNSYTYISDKFVNGGVDALKAEPQYCTNKVLCGFTPVALNLKANESKRLDTIIGYCHSLEAFNEMAPTFCSHEYVNKKEKEAKDVIEVMMSDVETHTSFPIFDEYLKNTYLDNLLRGGYPFSFKAKDKEYIYYLYSRRHGDLERDYNFFSIAPEYYSQGNGNFRDICQNRRSDSLICPKVKDYNLKYFVSLIQQDGYNPLGINGTTFKLYDSVNVEKLVDTCFADHHDIMIKLLSNNFTPGSIVNTVENNGVRANMSEEDYLSEILGNSSQNIEASFGEGFWVDHFSYLMDLVDNFISVYPDEEEKALFNDKDYKYYESCAFVQPRSAKTVLTKTGKIRQYGALYHEDDLKVNKFGINKWGTNWAKYSNQKVIYTNLYSKLFSLAFNKFALLDNKGIGIEMEAGKPGWNDAMNGLPGLFASGVSETFETKKIVDYLLNVTAKYPDGRVFLTNELKSFMKKVEKAIANYSDEFTYWDNVATAREEYREELRLGATGEVEVKASSLSKLLRKMQSKLNTAITKAKELGKGIYPTFIAYDVVDYEVLKDENGNERTGYKGYTLVKAKEFKIRELPKFLEGPARALKVVKDKKELREMYKLVKASDIYDEKLKTYKTSGDLDPETQEIGRIRAFTKGWLERESNFMHMTYKYLLGLLKAGLYKEFNEAMKTNLVCFMNPEVYGRSPMEHSSFIASSVNPDPLLHGQGFVARLSGTTAEMISIWLYMMLGKHMFVMENGELKLALNPHLHSSFFTNEGKVSFKLLGHTLVTYKSDVIKNVYDEDCISHYDLIKDSKTITLKEVKGEEALKVRNGYYDHIIAYIK